MTVCLFIYFWLCHGACRILVPQPGIEPMAPAVEAWSLNLWTAREVPGVCVIECTCVSVYVCVTCVYRHCVYTYIYNLILALTPERAQKS